MPHWAIFFGKASFHEQIQCRQALRDLVLLLCELVEWLSQTNAGDSILNRRVLDLLVVGLINIGMSTGNPEGNQSSVVNFSEVFFAVQKVSRAAAFFNLA